MSECVSDQWHRIRLRFLARLNPSKTEIAEVDRATEVTFLPMEAIDENGGLDLSQTRAIADVENGYTYLRNGDVAYAKITPCFENGKAAEMTGLTAGIAFGTTELTVLRPRPGLAHGRFLFWLIKSPEFSVSGEATMTGAGGQKRVPDAFTRDFEISCPPLPEQQAIAAFLDRETAKLDALVKEQRRLIALLKEKRQAVISHAVTKGLDPKAPLKPSGIDWLGDIPAHWEITRLKRVSPEITVGIVVEPSKYYVDEGVPALRSLNVRAGRIEQENLVFIGKDANETLVKSKLYAGDLVAVRTGQPGTCAVVPAELDGCNCIDLLIIRQSEAFDSDYLCWFMSSDVSLRQFAEGSGGAIQQHFNVSMAQHFVVAMPSLEEQAQILAFLSEEARKFDALTAEATRAIALLQERRAALISAAVTGKIDVRGILMDKEEAA
jgi:type I restriction enzyme S subunit